jgi:hypothetical protein
MNLSLCRVFAMAALATSQLWAADAVALNPSQMPRIGTVGERFQSFNIEMVEVTGGRFWAPYKAATKASEAPPATKLSAPAIAASAFRYRPPIDLSNVRLRKLAAALGPSYMRVSGTWANSTYFQDSDAPAPKTPPEGFGGVLTRQEWKGVIDFSKATNAKIITSFAISAGVRDANGVWTPKEAQKFLAFTKASGGSIAAAEFFNEPSFAAMGGAPKGYDAEAYGRDFKVFAPFLKKESRETILLGPGSVGEAESMAPVTSIVKSEDMLRASGPGLDAFSYHFYGAVSKRCALMPGVPQSSPRTALSEGWLSRTEHDEAFYAALRDRFEPGKPIWLTETGETACGGDPWASSFIDSFRYLEQLGRLAKLNVQVVAHNTLAASDYGLLDEDTLTPRPDYWAAYLWHGLMGKTVLDAGVSSTPEVDLFAQCMPNRQGGVTLLAINADRDASHELTAAAKSDRYTLSAKDLLASAVDLNGSEMKFGAHDALPKLKGKKIAGGTVTLAPATITFLAFPNAANASCQ